MLSHWAKDLRTYLELTQNDLAKLAKVSPKAIDSLERNQPLPLDDRRKILAALYVRKASKFG